jgi:hypothetical protein
MRPRIRAVPAVVFALVASAWLLAPVGAGAAHRTPPPARRGVADFNGDGIPDLAIAATGESVGGIGAGAVHILYGSATGLTADGDQRFTKATPGVQGDPQDNEVFGGALATGDFNDDGFSDLAIGSPFADGAAFDEGLVDVLYGSANGLSASGSQEFVEGDIAGGTGGEEHQFAGSLAAGDFDRDGWDDLAIGITGETVGGQEFAGAVGILYGSPGTGLTTVGSQRITEADLPGGQAHHDATFGSALTAADFGAGLQDDLAVGAPRDADGAVDAGSASIVYGSAAGLNTNTAATFVSGNLPGSNPSVNMNFGSALAWGHLAGDGRADLVVGAFGEGVGGKGGAGAAYLLVGRSGGVSEQGAKRFTESDAGVPSNPAADEHFGRTLTVGNFGGSPADDLAVGAPGDRIGALTGAGAVFVFPGTASGPDESATQTFTLNTPGVPGVAADNSYFGEVGLSAGNFGRGARADLAVASRFEPVGGTLDAGAVRVLYGTTTGLTGKKAQRWTAATKGVLGPVGNSYFFGATLL